jgi:predicted secreted hydrolase
MHELGRRVRAGVTGAILIVLALISEPLLSVRMAQDEPAHYVEPALGQADAPDPVTFPEDDGPHDASIEWWYYTGHLFTDDGERFGFEQIVFKGSPEGVPGVASHAAITDASRHRFVYDQRVGGPGALRPGPGFNIVLGDWVMRGAEGRDRLRMSVPGYEMAIELSSVKPATLHDGDGFIDYGNNQGLYYYSRTRLVVEGILVVDGEPSRVHGEAWMDHQWRDFETCHEGGWDWYSVQLEDGTELMLYVIKGADGVPVILDESFVSARGELTILDGPEFTVTALDSWTSEATGATYPRKWHIRVLPLNMNLTLTPTLHDQELDTRLTTGVIYWEGEVMVNGTREGRPVQGLGYVELTGYAS